ncbi:unnamed protein product [Echinostoma caproni]|uniref:EF-hand domain-containing protein n=1 Tax=Echinostoma caproni TaxID=27848 RepID=A0A183ADG0_9TREM|nr:unnamed protein product [Echinostoma caproni]
MDRFSLRLVGNLRSGLCALLAGRPTDGYDLVNTDACRALVALLDRDGSGRLTESDFRRVWEILRAWSRLFAAFDPQRSGHVTSLDFRIIVEQAGTSNSLCV